MYLSVYLSIYLSICLSICLSVCMMCLSRSRSTPRVNPARVTSRLRCVRFKGGLNPGKFTLRRYLLSEFGLSVSSFWLLETRESNQLGAQGIFKVRVHPRTQPLPRVNSIYLSIYIYIYIYISISGYNPISISTCISIYRTWATSRLRRACAGNEDLHHQHGNDSIFLQSR